MRVRNSPTKWLSGFKVVERILVFLWFLSINPHLFADIQLLPLTASWRYNQTANLDGVNWQSPGYSDLDWPEGPALLYVESNPSVTPRNTPLTIGRTTYYFRAKFNCPVQTTNALITFSARIDDGAVFYLNGQEIRRVRMPSTPTPIFYGTLATSSPSTGDSIFPETFILTGAALSNLLVGENVLAVEVHQNVTNSNDIVFGASATLKFTNSPPIFLSQPSDVSVFEGESATLLADTEGDPKPDLQWYRNGVAVLGATNTSLSFNVARVTNSGTYWLMASNSFGISTSSNAVLTVERNDPHHFTFERIPSPQFATLPFQVTITARSEDGKTETNFVGFCTVAANGQNGSVPLQSTDIGPFISGVWTGPIECLSTGRFVQLDALSAPGASELFHVEPMPYKTIDLQAEDLIYDPGTQRIYASVPSIGGIYSNSIAAIDPTTGNIVSSVRVGEIVRPSVQVKYRSGRLARSQDGQFLYVAVSNALAVQRYNLATQTAGPVFPVGAGQFGTALSVADLAVIPGAPTTVAVARANGYNAKGVAIYDNGVRRSATTSETFPSINVIEASGNAARLYGYTSQSTDFGFHRLTLNANGVSIQDSSSGLLGGFDGDIVYEGGLIFGTSGAVLNPSVPGVIGTFAVESSFACCRMVAPDSAMGRVFFLTQVGLNHHVQAHDLKMFLPLKSLEFLAEGGGKGFVRWGTNGLALASTDGKIYLIQSSLLTPPTNSPVDLVLSQTIPAALVAGSNYVVTLTVSNQGSEFASEVVLQDFLPTNTAFVSASVSQGTWSLNGAELKCFLGMIAPGSNAMVDLTLSTDMGGWKNNRATVVANEFDPNLTNNISAQEFFVRLNVRPNSVNQMALSINDIAYDPFSQNCSRVFLGEPARMGTS